MRFIGRPLDVAAMQDRHPGMVAQIAPKNYAACKQIKDRNRGHRSHAMHVRRRAQGAQSMARSRQRPTTPA
jgi:hypothetical protein